jgi:hypothetical protein
MTARTRPIRWLVGGAALVAVVATALWLGAPRSPSGNSSSQSIVPLASRTTAPASAPATEPTPIATRPARGNSSLQWNQLPRPDGNCCGPVSAVDGRLYLAGGNDNGPVVWYSDDIGRTWAVGVVEVPSEWNSDELYPAVGQIAGTADRLVAAGHRRVGPGVAEPAVWTSGDQGASWAAVANGSRPPVGVSLAWTGERFVAVLDNVRSSGRWAGEDPPLEVWSSPDGTAWQRLALPGELSERVAVSPVVGFDGRAAILVAEPSVASSRLGTPGSRAERDRSGEIWLLDAEGTWTRTSIAGEEIEAVGIGVGPYGLLAIASGDVDDPTRDLLRSTDGSEWTAHRIEISRNGAASPHRPLALAGWLSVVEGGGGIVITTSPGHWKTWHLAHGHSMARAVTGLTADLVAADSAFLGIWECGDFTLCIGPQGAIVAGLPTTDVQPDSLTGRLTSCFQDERGYTWDLQWPDRYTVESDPGRVANLLGPDGQVVARFGDELRNILDGGDFITVRGHRIDDGEPGGCVSGPTLRFSVTEIVDVVPG